MAASEHDTWRIWDTDKSYGDMLYRRAVGELPEMESSKALAQLLAGRARPSAMLDVGCGPGHYLRSLRWALGPDWDYTGTDATSSYIELARRAWTHDSRASFCVGDAFDLPFADGSYDTVCSSNLLLHLPAIERPISEMVRVARRQVVIRTLVGDRSFRIQEVYSPETHPQSWRGPADTLEFDRDGEPREFHYYNIYSKSYVRKVVMAMPGVRACTITADQAFDPAVLEAEAIERVAGTPDVTRMIGGWQVNGSVMQPWHFVVIDK